jgi:L-2-hydroxyglutarate oxidase LhgO
VKYDYLIVGSGIIGMTIAYELIENNSNIKVAIIDKEEDVAFHASGRNSGVLHAGFYYSADSLKAKFTVDGNRLMKEFCKNNDIYINETKKIVVAKDEIELQGIYELQKRAEINGVKTSIIGEEEIYKIDPNIKTYKKALYSPTTASVDPIEVCFKLKDVLKDKGVEFYFNTNFKEHNLDYDYLINSSGAYADKIAKEFGLAKDYTMLPFKGIYLKYLENKTDIKTNIYPVPNLSNPFLGVHYTIAVDGSIKIGPTAIPAFWRENYKGFEGFKLNEFFEIVLNEMKLFLTNAFGFRELAFEEMKKYNRDYFVSLASNMVKNIDTNGFNIWTKPGIRAQLLDKTTLELVQDFIVEGNERSIHILNAVSPAFTSSFPFARWIVENYVKL